MEVLVRAKPVQISACIRIIGYIFSRFILICRIITLILRTLKHENNKKLLNKFFFLSEATINKSHESDVKWNSFSSLRESASINA